MTEEKEKYADRIAKLLTLAEGEGPEAELAMVKADELMLKYAIDEAMVASVRGLSVDELVQDQFDYSGIYRNGHQQLGGVIAQNFGLKIVYGRDGWRKPIVKPLYVAGFKSDVERARLLDASVQLQCVAAFKKWNAENKDRLAWMDKGLAFRSRRDFVFGFAEGVDMKLAQARRAARAEAIVTEAERAGTTEAEAKESVALVLVNRKTRVDEYYDTVWGGRTRKVSHNYGSGSAGGRGAGQAAGMNANTNTGSGIKGNRGAIGR